MIDTSGTTTATPMQVWDVLADGWLYSGWVVGAARVRGVDAEWPEVGASVHHSVGGWPFLLNDTTTVEHGESGAALTLRARARPFIEALVRIELVGYGDGCEIHIREDIVGGPLRRAPRLVKKAFLRPRNRECLRRLRWLAEGTHDRP